MSSVLLYDVRHTRRETPKPPLTIDWIERLQIRLEIQRWISTTRYLSTHSICFEGMLQVATRVQHFICIQSVFSDAQTGFLSFRGLQLECFPHFFDHAFFKQHLYTLDLSYNRFEMKQVIDILPDEFYQLTSLTSLNFSHNEISTLSCHLTQLVHLKFLNFSHNQIERIPNCLAALKSLEELNLSHNPLRSLPKHLLDWAPSCTLVVENTPLSTIIKETFQRIVTSPHYLGPRVIGIEPLDTPLALSLPQIQLEWLYAVKLFHLSLPRSMRDRLIAFVRNPDQDTLDLSDVQAGTHLPIFQEPFTSRLKHLHLSPVERLLISPRKKESLKALETLD